MLTVRAQNPQRNMGNCLPSEKAQDTHGGTQQPWTAPAHPHGAKPCFLICTSCPQARTCSCIKNCYCHPSSFENEHLSATLDFVLPRAAEPQIFRLVALLKSPQGPCWGHRPTGPWGAAVHPTARSYTSSHALC